MFTHSSRQPATQPRTPARRAGTRIRRLFAVMAAITSGLLASAAIVPAAFAMAVPGPGGGAGAAPASSATVHVITTGGMPAWQITLIAVGAAVLAAAAAVLLDRALFGRRTASATTT